MEFVPNASLKQFNTFGLDAHCAYLSKIRHKEDLFQILERVSASRLFLLGGGSNILLPNFLDAWVAKIENTQLNILEDHPDSITVTVGAGWNWHAFVLHCLENDWGGLENLSLIPGTVGAAPIQNIGAYGVEVEQWIVEVSGVDLKTGEEKVFSKEQCQFGYRDSIFKNTLKGKIAITDVTLKLPKIGTYTPNTSYGSIAKHLSDQQITDPPHPREVSRAVVAIRRSKLPNPSELGNAGSFFKNPIVSNSKKSEIEQKHPSLPHYPMSEDLVKIPAGWLIEQCGWKGKKIGNVGCYHQQALVIIHTGGGNANEILHFAREIQKSVAQEFGIQLEPEVNIIGTAL